MQLNRTARTLLGITALAWSIPFDEAQKKEALLAASSVEGVKDVKDGLAIRK